VKLLQAQCHAQILWAASLLEYLFCAASVAGNLSFAFISR